MVGDERDTPSNPVRVRTRPAYPLLVGGREKSVTPGGQRPETAIPTPIEVRMMLNSCYTRALGLTAGAFLVATGIASAGQVVRRANGANPAAI